MSKIYKSGRELMFEGVEILFGSFRNFAGEKRKFNDAGKRNFNIQIEPDYIPYLLGEGVNVKYFKADYDDEEDRDEKPGFVKVNINYDSRKSPEIYIKYGEKGKLVTLSQNELGLLDGATFDNVDLVVNTYRRDEDSPVSLYLNSGYFTIHVDPIAAKYQQMEDEEEELPFS